jgi:hemerythrin-like domain-containing protein
LKALDTNQKGTKEWAAKLKVLNENVEHHVEEEEDDLFEKAEDILSDEDAEEIGEAVEEFKEEQVAADKAK